MENTSHMWEVGIVQLLVTYTFYNVQSDVWCSMCTVTQTVDIYGKQLHMAGLTVYDIMA